LAHQRHKRRIEVLGTNGGTGGKTIFKTDGKPAIKKLAEAVARYHGGEVIPETPPKGESQSNGCAEEAGKTVREFTRVLKIQLEDKAQLKIKCEDIITLWMIRWAAMLCSRYLVGKDNMTGYERRRGRKCNDDITLFGEQVWYKKAKENKEKRDKFDSEWESGIWLGRCRDSKKP
jgi:hypothetical protein